VLDADLTRLAQVFGNLLSNSAKYTPPGGQISVRTEVHGAELVVTVKDNGIGVPARALPRVFDMFSQVDRNVERGTGGLGIGLALVKGLVETHGGAVRAESAGPGQGSTFIVVLPIHSGGDALTSTTMTLAETAVVPARRKVVIADDSVDGAEARAKRLGGHPADPPAAVGQHVTIVALTGWGQESDRQRSHHAGCDGHLVKPIDFSKLEELLRELPDQ
jgi:hypothetical protein